MSSSYTFPPGVPVNPVRPIPDGEAPISIFGYIPNRAFAIVALVTFCVAFLGHTFYLVRVRGTRTFQALMSFGALCEIVGYGARLSASENPFIVVKYIIQYFFLVVSPGFFQSGTYIALAHALRRLEGGGRTLLGFNPKILVAVMITADVVTTIVQICGAALIGVAESSTYRDGKSSTVTSDQANNILLAGLALQTASFLGFLILLAVCISRSRKTTIAARLPGRFTVIMFVASLLLFLRTTYRLAETASGVFSYASRTEPLFACLEYLPVILAVLLFMVFPLYKLLPHASHVITDPEQHRFEMQTETSNVSNPTLVQPGSKMGDGK